MSIEPGYGETPLPFDELDALLPAVRSSLAEPVTMAAVYDLEQAIEEEVAEELLTAAFLGELELDLLLSDTYLRELHLRLYGDIWGWAGKYRRHEYNIGIGWSNIPSEVRGALETIRYRWDHTKDWTPRDLGIAAHAELVRIHPFTDGNGRSTRLLADLIFAAAQDAESLEMYDWRIEKSEYIRLLREYDQHRNPLSLAVFIPVYAL